MKFKEMRNKTKKYKKSEKIVFTYLLGVGRTWVMFLEAILKSA